MEVTQNTNYEAILAFASRLDEWSRKALVEAGHQTSFTRASYCEGQAQAWATAAAELRKLVAP